MRWTADATCLSEWESPFPPFPSIPKCPFFLYALSRETVGLLTFALFGSQSRILAGTFVHAIGGEWGAAKLTNLPKRGGSRRAAGTIRHKNTTLKIMDLGSGHLVFWLSSPSGIGILREGTVVVESATLKINWADEGRDGGQGSPSGGRR